jgi:hypothetical protein
VEAWRTWVGATFLDSYMKTAAPGGFLPESREELRRLLDYSLVRSAVQSVRQALTRRPDRLGRALEALALLIAAERAHGRADGN